MAEMWKFVIGFKGFYEVSNIGRVRSVKRSITRSNGRKMTVLARILLSPLDGHGYPHVCLHRRGRSWSVRVHILVARAFLGKPPAGKEVRHLNGDRADPRLRNLRYGRPDENGADKVAHGNSTRGEKNPNAVLTQEQVIAIRASDGTNAAIAAAYGVSPTQISFIRNEKSWSWL